MPKKVFLLVEKYEWGAEEEEAVDIGGSLECNICNMKYLQFMQYTQYASGSSKCNTLVSSPPGFVALGNCTLHKAHRNTDAWMLQKPRTLDGQAYKCACFQAYKCQSAWNRAYAQKHKYAQKHVYVRQHPPTTRWSKLRIKIWMITKR